MPKLHALILEDAQDAAADVRLVVNLDAPATDVTGALYGPRCRYARTLPADFPIAPIDQPAPSDNDNAAYLAVKVTDPCYWTPRLPFTYDLSLKWRDADGKTHEFGQPIGLRRLSVRGASFYLESRRIVFRGAYCNRVDENVALAARESEVALMVDNPTDAACDLADAHGVPLFADLRAAADASGQFRRLATRPSVVVAAFTSSQINSVDSVQSPAGTGNPILAVFSAETGDLGSPGERGRRQAIVVELAPEQRPTDLHVGGGLPVIAIRAGQAYADLSAARRACDALQADLAPALDCASYFVGP